MLRRLLEDFLLGCLGLLESTLHVLEIVVISILEVFLDKYVLLLLLLIAIISLVGCF